MKPETKLTMHKLVKAFPWRLIVAVGAMLMLTIGVDVHLPWWKFAVRVVGGLAVGFLSAFPEVRTPRTNPHDAAVQLSIAIERHSGGQLLAYFEFHPSGLSLRFHPALVGQSHRVAAVIRSYVDANLPEFFEPENQQSKPS